MRQTGDDRMLRHENAQVLDDPSRPRWLPTWSVVEQLALEPGVRVADIGAGTGYFAIPFARAVSPGGVVVAVDARPQMLDQLRSRREPHLPLAVVEGEATHTTLDDASVDIAFLANVWHAFDDHAAALTEMTRILRPAGRIAILDWRPDVAQPPGPPLEHRIAATNVRATLRAHSWSVQMPRTVGYFSYLVLATRP